MNASESLKLNLQNELKKLTLAKSRLEETYTKVKSYDLGLDLTSSQMEILEALSARFSRLSDILVKKIFRLIAELEFKDATTPIDLLNYAEKQYLIESTDLFRNIRELRNKIAHEYESDDLQALLVKLIDYVEPLINSVNQTIKYCQKFRA